MLKEKPPDVEHFTGVTDVTFGRRDRQNEELTKKNYH